MVQKKGKCEGCFRRVRCGREVKRKVKLARDPACGPEEIKNISKGSYTDHPDTWARNLKLPGGKDREVGWAGRGEGQEKGGKGRGEDTFARPLRVTKAKRRAKGGIDT